MSEFKDAALKAMLELSQFVDEGNENHTSLILALIKAIRVEEKNETDLTTPLEKPRDKPVLFNKGSIEKIEMEVGELPETLTFNNLMDTSEKEKDPDTPKEKGPKKLMASFKETKKPKIATGVLTGPRAQQIIAYVLEQFWPDGLTLSEIMQLCEVALEAELTETDKEIIHPKRGVTPTTKWAAVVRGNLIANKGRRWIQVPATKKWIFKKPGLAPNV